LFQAETGADVATGVPSGGKTGEVQAALEGLVELKMGRKYPVMSGFDFRIRGTLCETAHGSEGPGKRHNVLPKSGESAGVECHDGSDDGLARPLDPAGKSRGGSEECRESHAFSGNENLGA